MALALGISLPLFSHISSSHGYVFKFGSDDVYLCYRIFQLTFQTLLSQWMHNAARINIKC